MLRRSIPVRLLGVSLLSLLIGCSQQGSVVGPEQAQVAVPSQLTDGQQVAGIPGPPSAQYSSIWPHEDGTGWTYRLTSRAWNQPPPVFYPSPGDVPVITLRDAIRLLGKEPAGSNPEISTGSYRLQFSGTVTTLSGVTRQNLQETLVPDVSVTAPLAAARPGSAFLRLLARARPDLARKVNLGATTLATQSAAALIAPNLLHGYAWEQTNEWIGTYGDLNQRIAWIFLTPSLTPGSQFSLQLVPDLADDVFLHAQVVGPASVETDAGTFRHAVEVVYLIDFGLSQATDPDGNPLGYTRSYLYGTVDYVAGTGPVHSYERAQFTAVANGADYDVTASLESVSAPTP